MDQEIPHMREGIHPHSETDQRRTNDAEEIDETS